MKNQFDLIVVGAGALGTFHAYHALAMGKKVLLLEKDKYPVNATVRNFGMVIPSGMSEEWFKYGNRATELYKSIQSQYDISVRNNGTVYIASDDDEIQLIHELKAHYDHQGYASELLSHSQLLAKYPAIKADYGKEALFFPQEISVEPNLLIYRIHDYLKATYSNLTYLNYTAVVGSNTTANGVQVTIAGGEIFQAEHLVITTGHEFKLLLPSVFAAQDISVCKLQMLRAKSQPTLALEGNICTGLSIRRYEAFTECSSYNSIQTPAHLQELKANGIHILFKKAIDGTVIIGDSHEYATVGNEEQLGYQINDDINQLMLKEAARIADIDLSGLQQTWAGYYSLHNSKEICEVDIDHRIFIRMGIGGKGMTCSAGYAEASINQIYNR